jgi:FAD/FMN-containing dehydrogenase/Fe-S oxidoreductase
MGIVTSSRSAESDRAESTKVDGRGLAAELRRTMTGEVRFDEGSRALYATDGSNYRQVPIGVVVPRGVDDVIAAVAVCRRHGAPILPRGCGTSLAGQCCNVAVVVDFSKYVNRVLEVDADRKRARVEPGTILDDLRDAAERYHLTFGPDPATHSHCTLGGMIGNNSCGIHSVMAGKTVDNVEELDVLTYDGLRLRVGQTSDEELERIIAEGGRRGEIYGRLKVLRDQYADEIRARYPRIPRRVSGYNLDQLLPENGFHVARALVGTEGTCVTVLGATLRLVDSPPGRSLLVLGYPDIYQAADHVPEIMEHQPIGLEGIDDRLIDDMKVKGLHSRDVDLLPDGRGWLLVEFGGEDKAESDSHARDVMESLKKQHQPPSMKLFHDVAQEAMLWEIRESGLGATADVPGQPDTWPGWEDSAVPPEREGDYLRDLRKLFDKYDYLCDLYGHFGQGCIHVRIDFDFVTAGGIAKYRAFMGDATDLVLRYGGSLSGEHGDGQARAQFLPKMFGEDLGGAFREFKAIWDPEWKMNPGKVVDPYRIDENLRLGIDYRPTPLPPHAHFSFMEDQGSFARAARRCVGVGKCRRLDGGTMCPSFMVTREEEHSTRGRSRLLFEMLQGDPLQHGWRDDHVKEALDLCLACKGCKGDCPVNVDMATYKAEFLSHYYAGRLRPITAYSMGLIFWWARIAKLAPGLANLATQTPVVRGLAKALAGVAPQRRIPAFAPRTYTEWLRERETPNQDGPRVLLWPDTFNDHFFPGVARAAVEVLEAAGYRVTVPETWLCCGRPLYDFGMLDLAERFLRRIIDTLRPEIAAGVPIVVLEPSCLSVFRDELRNLFPNDEDARRLSQQSFLLSEFLTEHAEGYRPPRLERKAIVHGHCHHKAIVKMDAEVKLLKAMGIDFQVLDSGCCGMAGAFGFERGDHYDVSVKAGERVLLPAVRQAARDTLIVADGFSCREQIAQLSDRRALHLAQVLQMALHDGPDGPPGALPEQGFREPPARPSRAFVALAAAGAAAAGAAAVRRLAVRGT